MRGHPAKDSRCQVEGEPGTASLAEGSRVAEALRGVSLEPRTLFPCSGAGGGGVLVDVEVGVTGTGDNRWDLLLLLVL